MAETEVSVVVRAAGFDTLAAEATKAEAALKNMGAAVRGTNAAGAAAAKTTSDLMRGVNGTAIGTKLGNEIRMSMATALGNGLFWTNTFNTLGNRFKTFGRTLGRSLTVGVQSAIGNIRNMNGGNGPSHTDLIGGAILGGTAFKGVEELVHAAAERQGARFRLAVTNLANGDQRKALEDLAEDWSKRFGNISTTEGLDFLKDSLQIFGGTHELFGDHGESSVMTPEGREAMTRIAGLMSYSKAYQATTGKSGDTGAVVAQFAAAIRSGEIKGLGSNPIDLANWVEKLTKIQLATGVDPTTFLQAQRAAGLSFLTMNDDAIYKFAAMVQEQNSRAGVMAATGFMHMIGGGSQTVRSSEAMRKLGFFGDDKNVRQLVKDGKIELNNQGQIKHINDMSIIPDFMGRAQDPYKWYAETLYPAVRNKIMEDTGEDIGDVSKPPSQRSLDNIVKIMESLGAVFKNRNEANEAAESIIQAPQLERRQALARKAQIREAEANDLIVKQTQDFQAAMLDLKVNLGETVLPAVSDFLGGLAGTVREFGDFVKANPSLTGNAISYGGGALMIGGGIAGLGLMLSFMKLPFQILKSMALLAGSLLTGTGIAFADLIGGTAASGKLGKTLQGASKWLTASGTIGKILGTVGRLMSVLGTAFIAYDVGKWALNTKTGEALYESWQKGLTRWLHGDKATSLEKYEEAKAHWMANRAILSNVGMQDKVGPPPSVFDYVRHKRWQHKKQLPELMPETHSVSPTLGGHSRVGSPNQSFMPDTAPPSWMPTFRGFSRVGSANAASAGPIPVIVQQMPKQEPVATSLAIQLGTVTVNVAGGAATIGGAVGSAVGSKVSNALSDQHH